MITAPAYMAVRFLQRFIGFFVHWYGDGTRVFWTQTVRLLAKLGSLFGRSKGEKTHGFVFWTLRVLLGVFMHLVITTASAALYVGWTLFPLYVFLKVIEDIFINV